VADFSGVNFVVPKDGNKVLTVKANLNSVGSSGATAGSDLKVFFSKTTNLEVRGTGAGSSTLITSIGGAATAATGTVTIVDWNKAKLTQSSGTITVGGTPSAGEADTVTIGSNTLTEGTDWNNVNGDTDSSAANLKAAIDALSGYSASVSLSVVTVTKDSGGSSGNTTVFTASDGGTNGTLTLSGSGTLTGGYDNLVITVGGTALTQGTNFTAATDNTTTATSLASAIDALANVSASSASAVVTITADAAGTAGNSITLATSSTAAATVSGSTLSGGGGDLAGNSKQIWKTKPTVSLVALPSTALSNSTLVAMRFTVSADAAADAAFQGLKLTVTDGFATPSDGQIECESGSNASVRKVGDSTNIAGTCADDTGTATQVFTIAFTSEQVVSAGTSKTYDVRLTTTGSATNDSMSTILESTGFNWSDLSLGASHNSNGTGTDWSEHLSGGAQGGLYVKVLPTDSQTLSR